jgi:hypothetical protein
MKKPKNIPTYYNFPGTPVYRDTTALPFKTGGSLFPSLYGNSFLENNDKEKKKKRKTKEDLNESSTQGDIVEAIETETGLDPNLTYYKGPTNWGDRLFAKDASGAWYSIEAGQALPFSYDPNYLNQNTTKASDEEALGRLLQSKTLDEVAVTGEKLSWQKYQDEYEKSNPRGEYLEKRKKNYLKSHPGLNRAMGVTMNNFPEDALARFNDKYNKERNTYALQKFVIKDLDEDLDNRGQWIDDVQKSQGLYNMALNSKYGYNLKPNIFSRTLAGAEKLVDWIPGVDPFLDWATGKNRYNNILTEQEQKDVTGWDALAFTEYPGQVLANMIAEGIDPNSNASWETFSGSSSPIVTANPQLETMTQLATGAIGLPFNVMGMANLAKNVGKGVSNVAKANYYDLFKKGNNSFNDVNFQNFKTAENTAGELAQGVNTIDNTGATASLNTGQNATGANKILTNEEIKNIVANEQVPSPKTLLSTEGEILPESASWHTIMEDFKTKLREVDLTKPLTDEDYIKAANAINPEISKVASLDEIKAVHQEALDYFKGIEDPEDIALYIRDALAEKLPSIGEAPTMVDGYPTYSAGFSVSRSLDPNAAQYYGPKSVFDKAKEWGYDLNNLTPKQQNMLAAYTKGYDFPINIGKRFGFQDMGIRGDFYQKNANTLLDAILANKFPNDTSVIRSIKTNYPLTLLDKNKLLETKDISLSETPSTKYRGNLQKSDVIGDKGFLSTSLIPDLTWGKARLGERIMIPGGNKQSYGFPNASSASSSPFEGEIVLPSGLGREVVDVLPDNLANIVGYKYITKILNPYLMPAAIGTTTGLSLLNNSSSKNDYGASFNIPNAYEQMSLTTGSKAYGGPLNDRNINGKLLQSTYASPLGNMFREGGPFGENKGTFDYANSIYASQPGNYYNNGGPITKLNNKEEAQFQKFYNTLPDNLQTDDPTYDIRGYWDSEGRPTEFDYSQPKEEDGYYHGYSINSNTGEYLKSPIHETFQHAVDEDRKIGYRPVTNVYGRNIATYNPAIIEPAPITFLTNTVGPINYRTGGQFPRPYSLPEDSFKQGGTNLHNSVYASSNAQYPAIYKYGGSVLSMSNTPQLQGEGKDLTVPENAYIYAGGGLIKRADGSYSQRGLWDNIRAAAQRNKAVGKPGKQPTKQMLQQEKKINKNK